MNIPKNNVPCTPVTSFEIIRASVVRGNSVTFDMVLNGITIYGCWVRTAKDGHDFISYPQRAGNDGKYYSIVYVRLSDADQKAILDKVESLLS